MEVLWFHSVFQLISTHEGITQISVYLFLEVLWLELLGLSLGLHRPNKLVPPCTLNRPVKEVSNSEKQKHVSYTEKSSEDVSPSLSWELDLNKRQEACVTNQSRSGCNPSH